MIQYKLMRCLRGQICEKGQSMTPLNRAWHNLNTSLSVNKNTMHKIAVRCKTNYEIVAILPDPLRNKPRIRASIDFFSMICDELSNGTVGFAKRLGRGLTVLRRLDLLAHFDIVNTGNMRLHCSIRASRPLCIVTKGGILSFAISNSMSSMLVAAM